MGMRRMRKRGTTVNEFMAEIHGLPNGGMGLWNTVFMLPQPSRHNQHLGMLRSGEFVSIQFITRKEASVMYNAVLDSYFIRDADDDDTRLRRFYYGRRL